MARADSDCLEGDKQAGNSEKEGATLQIDNSIANRAQQDVLGDRSFPIPQQCLQI